LGFIAVQGPELDIGRILAAPAVLHSKVVDAAIFRPEMGGCALVAST